MHGAVARAGSGRPGAGRDRLRGAGQRQDARQREACRSPPTRRPPKRMAAEAVQKYIDGKTIKQNHHRPRPPDQHRRLMRFATRRLLALAVLLAGCGFQLRGTADLPFETIYVPPRLGGIALDLKRNIQCRHQHAGGGRPEEARGACSSSRRRPRAEEILSLTATGRVSEYPLVYRVGFRVHDGKGADFLPPNTIELTRDITFNDTEVLAKEAEEQLLFRDMQIDMVQQIMRRLASRAARRSPPPVCSCAPSSSKRTSRKTLAPRLRDPRRRAAARAGGGGRGARRGAQARLRRARGVRSPSAASTGASWRTRARACRCSAARRSSSCACPPASRARRAPRRSPRYCARLAPENAHARHRCRAWTARRQNSRLVRRARRAPAWWSTSGRWSARGCRSGSPRASRARDSAPRARCSSSSPTASKATCSPRTRKCRSSRCSRRAGELAARDGGGRGGRRRALRPQAAAEALLAGDLARYVRVLEGLRGEGEAPTLSCCARRGSARAARAARQRPKAGLARAAVRRASRVQQAAAARGAGGARADSRAPRSTRRSRTRRASTAPSRASASGDAWDEFTALGLKLAGGSKARAVRRRLKWRPCATWASRRAPPRACWRAPTPATKNRALRAMAAEIRAQPGRTARRQPRRRRAGEERRPRRRLRRPPHAHAAARRADGRGRGSRWPRSPTRSARSPSACGARPASRSARMRVPLGVIGIIYESRPNVTADAAGLCLKAGNACILRGGSEALHSNQAIAACVRAGLEGRRAARGRGAAGRHRRPRRGGRAHHHARVRRHHRAARRQGADRAPDARVAHPDDQAPRRRVPRLRRRQRRPGDGGADRRQRQDAALRHLQHHGDAAGGRGHRGERSCPRSARSIADKGVEMRADEARASSSRTRSPPPRRTTTPSGSRRSSRSAW